MPADLFASLLTAAQTLTVGSRAVNVTADFEQVPVVIGGNIDHIVVGPTGVFALETKNWKGHVSLSGPGILTVDGKHDNTKHGKAILGRALNLKRKIEALSNISTFVQAVMVFPLASVSVEQGTRCNLDVQTLKTLEDYLKRPSPSRTLTPHQVTTITRDLNALFKPNSDLGDTASPKGTE